MTAEDSAVRAGKTKLQEQQHSSLGWTVVGKRDVIEETGGIGEGRLSWIVTHSPASHNLHKETFLFTMTLKARQVEEYLFLVSFIWVTGFYLADFIN